MKWLLGFVLAVVVPIAAQAQAKPGKCEGILHQKDNEIYFGGGKGEDEGVCMIAKAEMLKLMAICAVGRFCRVTGSVDYCKDSGECVDMSRITGVSNQRGSN